MRSRADSHTQATGHAAGAPGGTKGTASAAEKAKEEKRRRTTQALTAGSFAGAAFGGDDGGGGGHASVEVLLREASPVLEALGNAKTVWRPCLCLRTRPQ